MADISILSRLVNGIQRNIDISANTLVTTSIKVGGGVSNTELTKTILDKLVNLQNGTDFANGTNAHTHDGRYFTESELGSATSSSGSDLIGDDDTYTNFNPTAATVKGALSGIDAALATAGGTSFSDALFEIYDDGNSTKKIKFQASGISASTSRTITMPDADVDLGNLTNSNISASAAIAYSKLNLSASIVNADVASGAAIAYSKLSLSNSIVNADIASGAAIALNKLAALTANRALVSDASGFVSASAVTSTELGYVSGVTSSIQTQLGNKANDADVIKKDGSVAFTGAQSMGGFKLTNLANGTAANDAINKGQLDAYASGALWLDPIQDPDLIDDSLSTPPGSPVIGNVYIAGASATGAWSGFDGYAFFWDGATWVDLLGRAVIVGDRFGVSMESATTAAGGLAGQDNKIAQITGATPGSITYSFTSPVNPQAVYVNNDISTHFGHSYTYSGTAWIEFGGPGATNAGIGLAWDGNTLNVKLGAGIVELPTDEVGVDVHTAGGLMTTVDNSSSSTVTGAQLAVKLDGSTLAKSSSGLKVATGGISNNEINASAAIAYSKLALSNSIVNADVAAGAAIAYSKLNLSASIVNADIASGAAIAYSKLSLSNSIVNGDLTANAVNGAKFRLDNNEYLRARNAANSADINVAKVDASNNIVLGDAANEVTVDSKSYKVGAFTSAWWGSAVFGLYSGPADGITYDNLSFGTTDHANNSTDSSMDVFVGTGAKPGASSTGDTGSLWEKTGDNAGSGDTGSIWKSSGNATGSGNSGAAEIYSGDADSGNTGYVAHTSGNSTSGASGSAVFGSGLGASTGSATLSSGNASAGNSGDVLLTVGSATGTQGAFKFLKTGAASRTGQVWKATSTDGSGYWADNNRIEKTFTAGESFAANTSYAVRIALTGETAGRVYKADYDASVSDKFYAYGMIEGNGAAAKSAGDSVVVIMMGTITLGSSDTNFAAGEVGQAVHLKATGAWDAVSQITYAADQASYRVGMVQEVDKILVGNMQLLGIN